VVQDVDERETGIRRQRAQQLHDGVETAGEAPTPTMGKIVAARFSVCSGAASFFFAIGIVVQHWTRDGRM
jgi:hypothetical protein